MQKLRQTKQIFGCSSPRLCFTQVCNITKVKYDIFEILCNTIYLMCNICACSCCTGVHSASAAPGLLSLSPCQWLCEAVSLAHSAPKAELRVLDLLPLRAANIYTH